MATFLNRKIFPLAQGGGSLNVNGALGLTTGVAGENLLENDLVFKSPDVITDWTVANDFIANEPVAYSFKFNNQEYVAGGHTLYKKNTSNAWEILLTYGRTGGSPRGVVPIDNVSFMILQTQASEGAIDIIDSTSNTVTSSTPIPRLFITSNTYNTRAIGNISFLVENNIVYFMHFIQSYNTLDVNTALTTETGLKIYSFNPSNQVLTSGSSFSFTYRTSLTASSRQATLFNVALIKDGDNIGAFIRNLVINGTTSSTRMTWKNISLNDLSFTYGANDSTPPILVNIIGNIQVANNKNVTLHQFNNKIYLVSLEPTVRVYEKAADSSESFVLTVAKTGTDFSLPSFNELRSTTFMVNGVLYFIALFTVSPYFASFAFIDNDWVLLQAPILPFEQNYGDLFVNNTPHASAQGTIITLQQNYVNVSNGITRFTSYNVNLPPNTFLWESTLNGVFSPEWIKDQQLFADAIGITQETKNINENVSVYQMTPNTSL